MFCNILKNGTDNNLVDPTLDLKWKKEKVLKYNIFVPKLKYAARLNTVPDIHSRNGVQRGRACVLNDLATSKMAPFRN